MKIKKILYTVVVAVVVLVAIQIYKTIPVSSISTNKPTFTTPPVQTLQNAPTAVSYKYANGMRFEIATTIQAKEEGLSGRTIVPNNYGMLFVFPQDSTYGIWMKNMLVPIDVIWLSDNGTIVSIKDSLATSTYPHIFHPSRPVRYVLETRAGFARERGWSVGSVVALPLPYGQEVSH